MTTPWQQLCDLDAWQVREVPRRAEDSEPGTSEETQDRGLAQRLAALVSAYHHGSALAFGWARLAEGGPVSVLAAGPALVAHAGTGAEDPTGHGNGPAVTAPGRATGPPAPRSTPVTTLTLPSGARGSPLPARGVASLLDQLPCWMPIAGIADGLLADDREAGQVAHAAQAARPSLEDGLLAVWPGPFAWLVFAEPLDAAAIDELANDAAHRQVLAQGRADRSPDDAVEVQRWQARHSELRQAGVQGLWRVRVLAGAFSAQAARQVAGLVCASADVTALPYELVPSRSEPRALEEVLTASADIVAGGSAAGARPGQHRSPEPEAPFAGSARLLAALVRPPEREVPGVRFVLRPEFDVTPETSDPADPSVDTRTPQDGHRTPATPARDGISLGQVLDRIRMPAGELDLPDASLNRHTFVCGATGAGKSQTIRALLEAATRQGLPWLVIEPAKAEYKLMAGRLADADAKVVRIRPGEADGVPAGINPLEPAPDGRGGRFALQTHADMVRALFLAAFEADEPFPQVLAAALTRCYEDAGWDLALGEPTKPGAAPPYPTLGDLQRTAEKVVEEIGYGREIADNVRGFIKVRISSLRLGTTGRFLEGGHPIDFGELLDRNVVLELEDVGDDRDKAFVLGAVLVRLVEHLRLRARHKESTGLAHLSVFEEAHRLLRRSEGQGGAAAHAVEMFAGLLAEIRAYGEGLVVAEQIPSKLVPDVIKNTAIKVVHRLPAADDREAVGATMNLTDAQSQFLVTLPPGEAAVFTDGMDYPVLTRMPDGTDREKANNADTTETVTPVSVVGRRGSSCGPDCQDAPCTLRDMGAAQRELEADPRITLWAEMTVLGHLTGWDMPRPKQRLADELRALPARVRDCALSHAVEHAVASRAAALAGGIDVTTLAAHASTAMRTMITDGVGRVCPKLESQWLARTHRWIFILEELQARLRDDPEAPPHPRTHEWERTYDVTIPGRSCADQVAAVHRWCTGDQADPRVRREVAVGAYNPSAIETALGSRAGEPDFGRNLTAGLDWFLDCRWPVNEVYEIIIPADPQGEGGNGQA